MSLPLPLTLHRPLLRPLLRLLPRALLRLQSGPVTGPRLAPSTSVPAWPGSAQPGFAGHGAPQPLALVAILSLHALLVWGLLQSRGVQQVLLQAQPLVVMLLADQAAPAAASAHPALPVSPPLAQPRQPRPLSAPDVLLPAPALARAAPAMAESSAPAMAAVGEAARPQTSLAPQALPAAAPQAAPAPQPTQAEPAQRQLPAAAIQFSEAPVVVYPRLSRRNAESGRVVVRAFVDATGGAPRSVQLAQSCGHPQLDEAALAAVQKARFKPSMDNGQPVAGWALIPIDFELEGAR